MGIQVSIVADSISGAGARITTFQLKYPRMIHSEVMTHRMFSRNASSTRAIPVAKMIEWVEQDPAMPVYWGKNRKGMQATEELTDVDRLDAIREWLCARDEAIERAKALIDLGVHKQIASRILEPWAHINVVVTATCFDNFFELRCDREAMPEMQALAVKMARAYRDGSPRGLSEHRWHLPYVSAAEREGFPVGKCLAMSAARCARVSYLTHEGKAPDPEADIALHDRLVESRHMSPMEHQARPSLTPAGRSGNFLGWEQYRQKFAVHDCKRFDFARLDAFGDRDFIV